MHRAHNTYRDFFIDVSATKSTCGALWIGHYKIKRLHYGASSASVSGPHSSAQDAIDNALGTAKEVVDDIIG